MVLLRVGAHVVFIAVCFWIGNAHGTVLRTHPEDWMYLAMYLAVAGILIGCYSAFAEGEFIVIMLLVHVVVLYTGYIFGMGGIAWQGLLGILGYVACFTIGLLIVGVRRA